MSLLKPKIIGYLKYLISGLFLAVVFYLLFRNIKNFDWGQAFGLVADAPLLLIAICLLLSAVSYSIFGLYDLLSLRHETIAQRRSAFFIPAVSCAVFTLNLGALVGAVGLRLKLYGKMGLKYSTISRVMLRSTTYNWLGYLAVFGLAIIIIAHPFYPIQKLAFPTRFYGVAILLIIAVFGLLAKKRLLRGRVVRYFIVPSYSEFYGRVFLAACNWCAVALLLVFIFSLNFDVSWKIVVVAYLVSAVGGVVAHVPAGLGVTEYIFIIFLESQISHESIIGGLLIFRTVYYLVPLLVIIISFGVRFLTSSGLSNGASRYLGFDRSPPR